MANNPEQIKQKIAVELENARLAGSFFLPIIASCLTLAFTDHLFPGKPLLRIIFAGILLVTLVAIFLYRIECLRNVRRFINELN